MPQVLTRARAWTLALVATFTMAISYVDRQTFAVLAPTVTKDLHISEQGYGWLASAFSISYLVGAPLAGTLVDRVGARRGLLWAVLLWSVVAGAHALVPGFAVLFLLRIALGFAEAPSFPGAAQTIHRALEPADRPRGFGILFTGSSLGAMIAAPLATWMNARFGWRVAFLGTAIVGLVWVPLWLGAAWTRAGRAALETTPADDAARKKHPVDAWSMIVHPAVLRAMAVVFASAPALAFSFLWGAKFLVHRYAVTQNDVGRYLWLPPLLFDVGAIAIGDRASRRAHRPDYDGSPPRALLAVATLMTASIAAMPFATTPMGAMAVAGLSMAGGGGLFAILTSDMLARVPPHAVSFAGGCTAAAQSLAYIIVHPLIGRAVQQTGSYQPVLFTLGLWVFPGCILWLLLRPPPPYTAPA